MSVIQNFDISRVIAYIDTDALRKNVAMIRSVSPQSKISAVVKANAYGHDMALVSEAVNNLVDGFSVATISEGAQLRNLGICSPIWILSGCMSEVEARCAEQHNLSPVICDENQLDLLGQTWPDRALMIKVDTGLGRFGFPPEKAKEILQDRNFSKRVKVLLSHFSDADNLSSEITKAQLKQFSSIMADQKIEKSIAASAGLLGWPDSHYDWVRPGIALYGASPFPKTIGRDFHLFPVMTLKSKIVAIRNLKKDQSVGYSGKWDCPEDMPVGIVGCGYGDGYPRSIQDGTTVLVGEEKAPIIGRISMDSMSIDLRNIRNCSVGQEVTLWGKGLPIESVATQAGTIPNELLTRISSRVPRILESDL